MCLCEFWIDSSCVLTGNFEGDAEFSPDTFTCNRKSDYEEFEKFNEKFRQDGDTGTRP
jgi:hypothetical protein